jgi:hypothetical protein
MPSMASPAAGTIALFAMGAVILAVVLLAVVVY